MRVISISFLKLRRIFRVLRVLIFSAFLCILSVGIALHAQSEGGYIETAAITDMPLVVIDAGHGGEDPGAIGVDGVLEKDLNLEIAAALTEVLEENGYAVMLTRTTDALLYKEEENIKGMRKIYDLKNRVEIAKKYPEAIFVSIHMNAFGDGRYSGLQVYYSENDTTSRMLANAVQSEVQTQLQKDNKRKIKSGAELYLLEHIESPAILIECGFLSNAEECKKLSEKEYQKQLCFAIVCGMINYENAVKNQSA